MLTWYDKYAAIAISAAVGLGAYEAVNWSSLSPSDFGTWIGSIGTVGALAGTIWIATSEKRDRQMQALDRAFVAASALESRLEDRSESLERPTEHVHDGILNGSQIEHAALSVLINENELWKDEEILPLIVLPGHVCAQLVKARFEVKTVCRTLARNSRSTGVRLGNRHAGDERGTLEEINPLPRRRHFLSRRM